MQNRHTCQILVRPFPLTQTQPQIGMLMATRVISKAVIGKSIAQCLGPRLKVETSGRAKGTHL